ncbi:hypothetical protein Tco_1537397, partial [Tanacetum coccineum]
QKACLLADFAVKKGVTAQMIAALARQRALEKDKQTSFSAATQEARFH